MLAGWRVDKFGVGRQQGEEFTIEFGGGEERLRIVQKTISGCHQNGLIRWVVPNSVMGHWGGRPTPSVVAGSGGGFSQRGKDANSWLLDQLTVGEE